MSSSVSPAIFSALRIAGTGPMPNRSGSTPAVAYATTRAMGASWSSRARPPSITSPGRGTVAHLAGIARRHSALHVKGRLQLAECIDGRVAPRPLVCCERHRWSRDDYGKSSAVDGRESSALMAAERERVLLLAADRVLAWFCATSQCIIRIAVDKHAGWATACATHLAPSTRPAGNDGAGFQP